MVICCELVGYRNFCLSLHCMACHLAGGRTYSKSVDDTGHQCVNGRCHVGTSDTSVLFYQSLISCFDEWHILVTSYVIQ